MEDYKKILERMQKKFTELAGYNADSASDIGIRLKVLAGEIFSLQSYFDWLKEQMFPQTASGIYLDYHAQQRGLERKPATVASGSIVFAIAEAAENTIEIPKGTICSTRGKKPVRYVTKEATTIPAGLKRTIVGAKCIEAGEIGNIERGNGINTLVTVPAHNYFIEMNYEFTNGLDEESDEILRKRISESLKVISNGTNISFYRDVAKSVSGVYSVGIIPKQRGLGTVDLYIAGKGVTSSFSTVSKVQNLIQAEREVNVDVKVNAAVTIAYDINMHLKCQDGYDIDDIEDEINKKMSKYFKQLEVGQPVYFAKLGEIVEHIEGVENYELDRYTMSELTPKNSELAVLGKINIWEAEIE